jgi:hypothetical protein
MASQQQANKRANQSQDSGAGSKKQNVSGVQAVPIVAPKTAPVTDPNITAAASCVQPSKQPVAKPAWPDSQQKASLLLLLLLLLLFLWLLWLLLSWLLLWRLLLLLLLLLLLFVFINQSGEQCLVVVDTGE